MQLRSFLLLYSLHSWGNICIYCFVLAWRLLLFSFSFSNMQGKMLQLRIYFLHGIRVRCKKSKALKTPIFLDCYMDNTFNEVKILLCGRFLHENSKWKVVVPAEDFFSRCCRPFLTHIQLLALMHFCINLWL